MKLTYITAPIAVKFDLKGDKNGLQQTVKHRRKLIEPIKIWKVMERDGDNEESSSKLLYSLTILSFKICGLVTLLRHFCFLCDFLI